MKKKDNYHYYCTYCSCSKLFPFKINKKCNSFEAAKRFFKFMNLLLFPIRKESSNEMKVTENLSNKPDSAYYTEYDKSATYDMRLYSYNMNYLCSIIDNKITRINNYKDKDMIEESEIIDLIKRKCTLKLPNVFRLNNVEYIMDIKSIDEKKYFNAKLIVDEDFYVTITYYDYNMNFYDYKYWDKGNCIARSIQFDDSFIRTIAAEFILENSKLFNVLKKYDNLNLFPDIEKRIQKLFEFRLKNSVYVAKVNIIIRRTKTWEK